MMDHNDPPTTNLDPPRSPMDRRHQRCLGGRFALQDPIGAGGGAMVVRARDRQFPKRLVAIKLLRSRDEDLQRRFVQEAEVLSEVDHPSIVRVLGRDTDGDDFYTVLELLEGPDLFEHLVRSGPLPWRQIVAIGIQIAGALDAVHSRGLVHRDVKPANIMLAADGRVKLIDFGIVRITENYRVPTGAVQRRVTELGKALGTPGYLPLEAGLVAPNASFDVFALGATLYQLLTGKMPEEPLQPLRNAHPGGDAPADLELVLAAALALEPEDRTQSAAELGRALAAVLAAHPERGTPSTRIDGRYELIGLAGTGAKADAHVAVHRGAGHDVVLKFLRSSAPDDALRFAREAKILNSFSHPALPRFFDYAPEAKPPYIAMAHAPGQPAARLCSPPRLKPAEVAQIGVKLAQVLAMVHARGVLHRDINANNVLIDANGSVTLIDFGSADLGEKFHDVPAGARRYLTPPEARIAIPDGGIGQLAWSAPEVRTGNGWTDKSDVYSMGHLLFRLLTGKLPTKGADPPSSPLDRCSACPEDLSAAIESTLQVDPNARPSAAQFARTLLDVLESEEEALARAVAVTPPAGRPPLRLVPTEPQARADWTQHPIPEATSSDLSQPPLPSILRNESSSSAPAMDRASSVSRPYAAGLIAGAVGLAWWVGTRSATRPIEDQVSTIADLRPEAHASPRLIPLVAPMLPEPAAPKPPTLLPMHDALDEITPALRACSKLAGGLLMLEFTIFEKRDTFGSVAVTGSTGPDLDRCVRDATAELRFAPQAAETFNRDYAP